MAQHNAAQDVAQSPSNTKIDKRYMDVFKRKEPLKFTPKRKYVLGVISPLQKHDSGKSVFADGSYSGTSTPAHSNNTLEEITFENPRRQGGRGLTFSYQPLSFGIALESQRRRHVWQGSLTTLQPFSFDARDSAQKAKRERRLRQMREQQLSFPTFKAHPVRRYKPLPSQRPLH